MADVGFNSKWSEPSEAKQDTQPQPTLNEKDNAGIGSGFVLQPREKPEAKTRRVNAVFKPSVYDKFAQIAQSKGYSVNDLLNRLVVDFIEHQGQ